MKTKLIMTVLVLFMCVIAWADISQYYTFNASTETYTPITGTPITDNLGDDMLSAPVDIGFTFTYGLNVFTQVVVSSNGWVGLGTTASHSNLSNQLSSADWFPVLAPLWDDTGLQTGSCAYLMTGTAPNRVFTVQYTGLHWYYSETNTHDYQVKMYESGLIKFVYGAESAPPTNASASIGINMAPGGSTNYWSITPGAQASASNTVENNTITTWPGNGTVYNFNPPMAVPNDMAAMSISGNLTPTQGTSSNYTVNIRNFGTAAQSNYSVKLMAGTTELASVPGPAIPPATNAAVVIPWIPGTPGPLAIYGKVVLTGDQNPINDQTGNLNITIQPEGTTVVTIGDGNQLALMPVDMYYRNSLFETIYPATEITAGGVITGISFYNNFVTDLPSMPTKIWLGATAQTDLSGGWIPSSSMIQVFDGTVNYPSGQNIINIPFSIPFAYGGTNLVMMVNRPMDTQYYNFMDNFYCQTVGTNRSLFIWNDGIAYDPANPPAQGATLSGQFPKTSLYFTPPGPNPVFGVAPAQRDFGTILMDHSISQAFTAYNSGGGSLVINNVELTGSPHYALSGLPTLPVTLTTGQNITFTCTYHPTVAGTHAATINITDNLTRVVHPVPLTGTSMDPTIYTSPYTQNWDAVTAPALPLDWQKIYASADQWGYVQTESWLSHSASNAVQLYNSGDASATVMLISPPLANTIPIVGSRVKFWARGDNASSSLIVGIMTNPLDAATFTAIQTVTMSTIWTEYIVGFQTYTGTGHYIAFKHGNQATWQNIYVDDVLIEETPQNDLAALTLTGNTTPSVGMTTNYTVNLFNWGTQPQTQYTVKLYKEGNVEIASVAGALIAPGTALPTTVSWTPTTAGPTFIYAKVILVGDQNTLNDQTPNVNVAVQAAGTLVVTIGEGNELARMPLDMFYMNSLFEGMYYATELNFVGMITGISFYNNFVTDLPNMPTKVWLGSTTQADLTAGWIPSTELTAVFDGTVNYPSGENVITVTFPTPFLYLEGNLVMMVERPMDTQYYNSMDQFLCQTVGTSRARNAWSDGTDYDPTNPPAETTPTGQFPKTSFFIIPGGVGHLTGTVYGAGNVPLANAQVQIVNGAQATTNAQGVYMIHNIIDGDYQVTVSRYGYISQTVAVTIPEDETVTQNFTLVQMPTVTLTGLVVGSDAPTIGLPGAILSFTGYEDYSVTTDATGHFSLPGVYTNQTYEYIVTRAGYQTHNGTVVVGAANQNMGTITMDEVAYSPRTVVANENATQGSVTVVWQAPDPNAVDITEGFESIVFPPTGWTRTVTDNGPPNTSGVYPTWCRFGEVTVAELVIPPAEGDWQAGFWWSFSHQDEWLITPQFNCPQGAALTFDSNVFLGSTNGDHYYVKVSIDNGSTWNPVWDASALTGGWNHYDTPISISLNEFSGQQIKVAWHADDPANTSDGMWYVWFLDNIVIANRYTALRFGSENLTTLSASNQAQKAALNTVPTRPFSRKPEMTDGLRNPRLTLQNQLQTRPTHSRSLVGYKVWRLTQGQEQNEQSWSLLTPETITVLTITDTDWATLDDGTYKWAIKGIYTGDVLSLAVFSNPLVKQPVVSGTLAGLVRNAQLQPIMGAVINVGTLSATTAANGSYVLQVPAGTHTVTCTANGYQPQTVNNVVISPGQTTPLNITMPVGNEDEIEAKVTVLKGNYPNPFNPETTLSFDVKDRVPVRIDIYNTKGQLIRTLLNEVKANGRYTIVWNGKDNNGNSVASGIYNYRMQAGSYKATRRMMLLK